jgi:D-3-phosphoglycerate dehydrogenase
MNVFAWSENLTKERCEEIGVGYAAKDALFADSDVISIHLVSSERTRGIVGIDELTSMKSSAYLINTSRGPIVDEAALIEALSGGTIAGAGIDVYDVEPLPADHPLRSFKNAVLTGHTGYVVKELYALAYGEALENVRAWMDGTPIRVLNGE